MVVEKYLTSHIYLGSFIKQSVIITIMKCSTRLPMKKRGIFFLVLFVLDSQFEDHVSYWFGPPGLAAQDK